ncbi:MAG: diphosphate--fructose-6-phosphate 1-phosphotransferase [Rhabdochlamydiaceae bacterium]|nr:diphosphate--fructose-6-phosphate 1-phosphotransferase [Candidatus Amphrikana amoebophyrae]
MIDEERKKYKPTIPKDLINLSAVSFAKSDPTSCMGDQEQIQSQFSSLFGEPIIKISSDTQKSDSISMKIGVVFSGGQASGGHNVICGLFDAIGEMNPKSELFGFIGGPSGIVENQYKKLEKEDVDFVRNMGGFDLIGSGRTKIETDDQLKSSLETAKKLKLDAIIVIGGDDSNTNAAFLAQYFLDNGCTTSVIGVPKTIDGDLRNDQVEISFGFDTACKCYSEMISNIERDAISAKKYYHFIKLMGRSASHIALECALNTHPNFTVIGEEVKEKKMTLDQIVSDICDMIVKRSEMDHNFGVVLIPEGLIEFIPEMEVLIGELNSILAKNPTDPISDLSSEAKKTFQSIPKSIQDQLLLDRDPHGNVQVSHISTEKLISQSVKEKLKQWEGYKGKFSPVEHFFGYEGRAAFPSNFDATYCYALGRVAALLAKKKLTGYMALVKNLTKKSVEWVPCGVPIVSMMNMEIRKGKSKPVIRKSLVDLNSKSFKTFANSREEWMFEPCYNYVGSIQYFGPESVTDQIPKIVQLEG